MTRNRSVSQMRAAGPSTELPTQPSRPARINTISMNTRVLLLNETAVAITRAQEVDDVLGVLAARVPDLLRLGHLSVCLRTDNTWRLRVLVGDQTHDTDDVEQCVPVMRALSSRQLQLVLDGSAGGVLDAYGSVIVVPLEFDAEHQIVGTLNIAIAATNAYTADDTAVASLLAQQAATGIRNAERFRALRGAQERLAAYAIQLEERNRELDAYAYTVAHDLKAPLNLVYGYSHLLETMLPDDMGDAQDYIVNINRAVHAMTRMIDQLLFLARLDQPDMTMETVDSALALHQALERFEQTIHERHIQVDWSADLPSVCAFSAWMEEVFANLISNAIKYIGEKNPSPRIAVHALRDGDKVRFEVTDNGIGIPAADQPRLFDRFTRLHAVKAEGNGLGLAIVNRIVNRIGGEVGVISAPGKGSTFWFTVPAAC